MELVKSFFRKRKTKIYIFIFSIVIIGMISLNAFIDYYDNLLNDYLQSSSYISFVSEVDYLKELKEMKDINIVKKGYMVLPNYSYTTLKKSGIYNAEGPSESGSYISANIYWDLFLLNDSYTDLYLDDDFGQELCDNEILLFYPLDTLNAAQLDTIEKLKGEKIGFKSLNGTQNFEFAIKDIINSNVAAFVISDARYNSINEIEDKLYSYRINTIDYKLIKSTRQELLLLNRADGFGVINRSYAASESYRQQLVSLVTFLKVGSFIGIILLFIVFTIICNDSLKDERKNIYVQRIVGYNKRKVMVSLLKNLMLLIIISTVISVVFSIVLFVVLNWIFNLNLVIFNIANMFIMFLMVVGIFLFELVLFCFKLDKCLKKDYMKF